MRLITHLNFNNNAWTFNLNGTANELISASQFAEEGIRYKFKYPWRSTENDRFALLGDGSYHYTNESGENSVACIVLEKMDDNSNYVIPSLSFKNYFEEE